MAAYETEIRRTANGSIDTDHHIRHSHRQRSLAAHEALARMWSRMGHLFKIRPKNSIEKEVAGRYDESTTLRKAA